MAHHEGRRAPRLLVVGDDDNIAELIALWFGIQGWAVLTAPTGPEGLSRIAVADPDAIVVDLTLAGAGGLEALRLVRARRPSITVAVVVFGTTTISEELRNAAAAAGVDCLLTRPWSLVDLEGVLTRTHSGSPRR